MKIKNNSDKRMDKYLGYLESQLNHLYRSCNTFGPTLEEGRGVRIRCYTDAKNKFLEIFNVDGRRRK